jgi:NADPH2 dehydrogenase
VGAGFDLVEFHSAHGYGFNQWLSPLTNRRDDRYGRDLAGRSRLLREVIQQVRSRYPELLLSVRLPGQDFLERGLTLADTVQVARWLQAEGVNTIHISSGIGGWRRPDSRSGEGYLVEEAAVHQSQLDLPVIGVGGIETGDYIDQGLRRGHFALAAVGRAILADPRGWHEKTLLSEGEVYAAG